MSVFALTIAPNAGGRGTEALDTSDIALTDLERKISSGIAGIVPFKSVLRLGPSPSWQNQIGV